MNKSQISNQPRNNILKCGDVVMIYADPITRQRPEGKAKLRRETHPNEGDGLVIWEVKFLDDGFITERAIKVTP